MHTYLCFSVEIHEQPTSTSDDSENTKTLNNHLLNGFGRRDQVLLTYHDERVSEFKIVREFTAEGLHQLLGDRRQTERVNDKR